jgi:hypothetical protein
MPHILLRRTHCEMEIDRFPRTADEIVIPNHCCPNWTAIGVARADLGTKGRMT